MSKFCSKCGAEIKPGDKFCNSCGTEVIADKLETKASTSAGKYEEDHDAFNIIFKTTGRLNRLRYLKRCLTVAVIELVVLGVAYTLFSNEWGMLSSFGSVVVTILLVSGQVPYYCLNVRRLQDLDKDDTLAKILFVIDVVAVISSNSLSMSLIETVASGVATIACIYLVFFPGTHGDNKYGADPLG